MPFSRLVCLFVVLAGAKLLSTSQAAESGTWSAMPDLGNGIQGQIEFEKSDLIKQAYYGFYQVPPRDWYSQSGAAPQNNKSETDPASPWFIEWQLHGGKFVSAGVILQNRDLINWGLKVIDWGFSRMDPDGNFKHADSYHSASFFIESVAHGLLLLQASPYQNEFSGRIAEIKPRLLTAARWMIRPDIKATYWPERGTQTSELPYGHRRYLDACALGETGVLCGDKELVTESQALVRNGIAFQRPDGVNPERGGYDTSYHAIGLMYACRYYQIVADAKMREEMKPMLEKGVSWLYHRIQPDGSIDMSGNSRTGPGKELTRSGNPKEQEYPSTVAALLEWGRVSGNKQYQDAAARVAHYAQESGAKAHFE